MKPSKDTQLIKLMASLRLAEARQDIREALRIALLIHEVIHKQLNNQQQTRKDTHGQRKSNTRR